MNEIEDKRKAIKEELAIRCFDFQLDCQICNMPSRFWHMRHMCIYCFIENMLKKREERTRKEILEKLRFLIDDEYRVRIGRHPERDKHIIRFGNHVFKRLKQSLEEKE